MADPVVQVYANLDTLSAAAAAIFVQTARMAHDEGRDAWIALSGGSTPKRLFETLATLPWRDRAPWERVQIVQVDERPVPPDRQDSNYRLLRETLLDFVAIPSANVHRMPAEIGAGKAADEYEAELKALAPRGQDGFPRLDLVFLGLGDDGHTASLFPHSPGLRETVRWVIANPIEKLALERITLTYPVLNGANRVVFLVSGPAKATALTGVLNGIRTVEDLPARGVRPSSGELLWLVDRDATSSRPCG